MAVKANYFKIGLFTLGSVFILIIAIVMFGFGDAFKDKVIIETYINESVQGLEVGSPVKHRGVKAGKVEEISFVSSYYVTTSRYVLVRFSVDPAKFIPTMGRDPRQAVRSDVRKGLRLHLAPQGITGLVFLEADYVDPKKYPAIEIDWNPQYLYIPSVQSTVTRVVDTLNKVMETISNTDLDKISKDLEKSLSLMSKVLEDAEIATIRKEIVALLKEARSTNGSIKKIVDNPNMKSAIDNAAETLKQTRKVMDSSSGNIEKILKNLGSASQDMNLILKRLDTIMKNQHKNIETIIENSRKTSTAVRDLTDDAEKYPSLFIFGNPPAKSNPKR